MRLLALLCALAACTPDYSHTAFLCDVDRDCPAEHACIEHRCRRGELGDGDGVACRTMTCDQAHQCCTGDGRPPHCIGSNETCPGIGALCDGDEDCRNGDHCCVLGDILSCNTNCPEVACRDASDCPQGRPNCCGVDGETPWGLCQTPPC